MKRSFRKAHAANFRTSRLLPASLGCLAAIGLAVACGKPNGGREVITRGNTPPGQSKISADKYFQRANDMALAQRVLGLTATAVTDGAASGPAQVTLKLLIVDPASSQARTVQARKVVLSGQITPVAAANQVAGQGSQNLGANGNLDQQLQNGDNALSSTNSAAAAPGAQAGEVKGEPLSPVTQESSQGAENYQASAVCEDAKCNHLIVAVFESAGSQQLMVKYAFQRPSAEKPYRMTECPKNPEEATQAIEVNPRIAMRARRAMNVTAASVAAQNAQRCQAISSFETAYQSAPGQKIEVLKPAQEPGAQKPAETGAEGSDQEAQNSDGQGVQFASAPVGGAAGADNSQDGTQPHENSHQTPAEVRATK